jgi:outer membrane protein insertion porin family
MTKSKNAGACLAAHSLAPLNASDRESREVIERPLLSAPSKALIPFALVLCLLVGGLSSAWGQLAPLKVVKIEIKHVGPQSVSDELIRSNVRVKSGNEYGSMMSLQAALDDDVRNLYATGFFYNIQVTQVSAPEGVTLTYIVQGKPRLTEIRFHGNTKYKDAKLLKKISSKVGEPLDERKLFTDSQDIKKMYQKSGYPRTEVTYALNIDPDTGRGTATFEIAESYKVKIIEVDFVSAKAFTQRKLRRVVSTRKHWMFSWITGHGFLKDDDLEDDKEKLAEFYRDHGYIDFELKDVQFVNPTARTMIVRFIVYEGVQYKVGAVKFTGNKIFSTPDITNGVRKVASIRGWKYPLGPNGLPMDVGTTFTPKGLGTNMDAVEDFYGSKGYIDVTATAHNLNVVRIPNTESGTMDLEFQINEGKQFNLEKIEIRGNVKTKDKVIRRELAVSPGETFDMLRVKISKERLQGLNYFEKVDTRAEATEISQGKNLVVGVEEKNTGNFTLGAGFSSVDAVVGFAEVSQGNFDLFHPPTFTGGGQKFRLRVQLGTERQDYLATFIEPWLFGRKLQFQTDLYYRDLAFQSPNNIYDEIRGGGRVSLTRALGSDSLIGSVSYTLEDVGIQLNNGFHPDESIPVVNPAQPSRGTGLPPGGGSNPGPNPVPIPANVPNAILDERGYSLLSRVGSSIAYDTRNSVQLPNKGQRTELSAEVVSGDRQFYKLDLRTAWFFKGFATGHVLELDGRAGSAESLESRDVPFYDRYYLGGLYSLRGFKYRSVSPRQVGFSEPIGGDTSWFASAEYSIPIIERLRFAVFYDIGNVGVKPYNFKFSDFDDNWGVGLRLNLPIGPLRLDYGIPIHHDEYNGSSGQFQFGVGYFREF